MKIKYAPFHLRLVAFVTDLFMIGIPISILMMAFFGYDSMNSASGMDLMVDPINAEKNAPNPIESILQIMISLVVYVVFWKKTMQTPGKKMMKLKVLDSKTFKSASYFQLIVRFVGYFVSLITIVGFFIGLMRKDNRALHDLLSRTCVVEEG
ncbi:MAG: hypothetical protein GQ570_14450 [Helicobacteraceae bacterium]|nr:hypothetical protein [Helicobacteraceae bacterium]